MPAPIHPPVGAVSASKSAAAALANTNVNKVYNGPSPRTPVTASMAWNKVVQNDFSKTTHDSDGEQEHEEPEAFEPKASFTPVINLTTQVDFATHDPNEWCVFTGRAKLYHRTDDQWKERGTGTLEILHHTTSQVARIIMRRDAVLKVCANHRVLPGTTSLRHMPGSYGDRAWVWTAFGDISGLGDVVAEGVPQNLVLAAKFASVEVATRFKAAVDAVVEGKTHALGHVLKPVAEHGSEKAKALTQQHQVPGSQQQSWANDARECDDEEHASDEAEAFEPTATFTPVLRLTHKVAVVSSDNQEPELFSGRAKLFRYIGSEWKERGTGVLRVTMHTTPDGQSRKRIIMRRDQVLKVCANHFAPATLCPMPGKQSGRSWTWKTAGDAAEDSPNGGLVLAARFASDAEALAFHDAVLLVKPSKALQQMGNMETVGAFTKETEANDDNTDDHPEEFEPKAHFTPVIQLTQLVRAISGDEADRVLFCGRAKLYRHANNQWKERGTGEIKVTELVRTRGSTQLTKKRIVMRRDQVLKVCANHLAPTDLKHMPGPHGLRSWVWTAIGDLSSDCTSTGGETMVLAAKFADEATAQRFADAVLTAAPPPPSSFERPRSPVLMVAPAPVSVQEHLVFDARASMFVFRNHQWTPSGRGNMQLLIRAAGPPWHPRVRMLGDVRSLSPTVAVTGPAHRSVPINHYVNPFTTLVPLQPPHFGWVWTATSLDSGVSTVAVRFGSHETAVAFAASVAVAKEILGSLASSDSASYTPTTDSAMALFEEAAGGRTLAPRRRSLVASRPASPTTPVVPDAIVSPVANDGAAGSSSPMSSSPIRKRGASTLETVHPVDTTSVTPTLPRKKIQVRSRSPTASHRPFSPTHVNARPALVPVKGIKHLDQALSATVAGLPAHVGSLRSEKDANSVTLVILTALALALQNAPVTAMVSVATLDQYYSAHLDYLTVHAPWPRVPGYEGAIRVGRSVWNADSTMDPLKLLQSATARTHAALRQCGDRARQRAAALIQLGSSGSTVLRVLGGDHSVVWDVARRVFVTPAVKRHLQSGQHGVTVTTTSAADKITMVSGTVMAFVVEACLDHEGRVVVANVNCIPQIQAAWDAGISLYAVVQGNSSSPKDMTGAVPIPVTRVLVV
ncbi:hypothetical protein BC828DRAFT_405547 [Blastocladiella britannica]|nr:hypothetical protein BC828DRAFT_405547 [Blastocladiella britannica]